MDNGEGATHLTVRICSFRNREIARNEGEVVEGRVVINELEEEELDDHGVLVQNIVPPVLQISELEGQMVINVGEDLDLDHVDD